ncbi:MAG: GMC family oxidoreductase N-terminal domain-containing protein [Acetobacteraceae bacterium]
MMRGCQAIGLTSADGPVALITAKQWTHETCVGCGACHQGCRNQAKLSADVTYIPRALAAGAEIRAECFAP